jgi:hypothetical protein
MTQHASTQTGAAGLAGLLAACLAIALSACVSAPSRDGAGSTQRAATADANAASFWASFEQNCSLAGLQLVKLKLDSGYAMICSGNRRHCANWVSTQLTRARASTNNRRVTAEVAQACKEFPEG